ncbi:MAG: hypothetical protein ABJQ29_13940 [Luteolibacter sp.]
MDGYAEAIHPDQPGRIGEPHHRAEAQGFYTSLEAGWASRYIAEGREAFGDNGLTSFLAILGYRDFSVELWQGLSDGSSAREFQASVYYSIPMDPVSITFGLTHINDTRGGDEDLDLSLTLSSELCSGIFWDTNFYHGSDRGGSYLESGISHTWETPYVDINLGAHLGTNFGYVVDGHKGADHFVLSADFSKEVAEGLTLSAGYSYIFDIDRDPTRHAEDQKLYQGSLFGFAAEYSF